MTKLVLALICATTLGGCVGVFDRCTKGLNPPVDGWATDRR